MKMVEVTVKIRLKVPYTGDIIEAENRALDKIDQIGRNVEVINVDSEILD